MLRMFEPLWYPFDDLLGCLSGYQKEIDSLSEMQYHLQVSSVMEHKSNIKSLNCLGEVKVILFLEIFAIENFLCIYPLWSGTSNQH